MSKVRSQSRWSALVGVLIGATAGFAGTGYELAGEVPSERYLPAAERSGAEWRVAPTAVADGTVVTYTVESRFGAFEARGRSRVAVRAKEVEALAELDRVSKSDVFLDAVKSSALGSVEVVKDFAQKPVETIKGIGGGAKRLLARSKYQLQETKVEVQEGYQEHKESRAEEKSEEEKAAEAEARKEKTEAVARQQALKYLKISGAERRWYAELGVDPYTDNEPLRETIQSFARIEGLTRFGMRFVGLPSIPGAGELRDVMQLVWETDPWDLRKMNREKLIAMGLDEETARAYEDHPWVSLSQQTSVVSALAELDGVDGRGHLVARVLTVASREEAQDVVASVLLLTRLHRTERPLAEVLPGSLLPVARARDGSLQALMLADALLWTEGLAEAAHGFAGIYAAEKAPRRELRTTGEASERFRAETAKLGWTVIPGWRPAAV